MKTSYKQFFIFNILLVLISPVSCVKPKPQTFLQAHYEFKEDDFDKLLSFELEKTIKYRNNLGLEVTYNADFVTDIEKAQYIEEGGTMSILFIPIPLPSAYYFFYDVQLTSFNNGTLKYGYARFPLDIEQAQENVYEEYPSEFAIQIYFFQWNENNQHMINIDIHNSVSTMSINGVMYNSVYTIESGNADIGPDCSRVNKVYYDLYTGIIGYDEIDGLEWRLVID